MHIATAAHHLLYALHRGLPCVLPEDLLRLPGDVILLLEWKKEFGNLTGADIRDAFQGLRGLSNLLTMHLYGIGCDENVLYLLASTPRSACAQNVAIQREDPSPRPDNTFRRHRLHIKHLLNGYDPVTLVADDNI